VDWLASHDTTAAGDILAEDYELTIGSVVLSGRDTYLDATMGQLNNFPGLCLTVHDIVISGSQAAIHFSEHGAAANRGGRVAAWTGVTLFRAAGGVLQECWCEEDYASRSAQLSSGQAAQVGLPHVSPWDSPDLAPHPEAEAVVLKWLAGAASAPGVIRDNGSLGATDDPVIGPLVPDVMFSAGSAVAFHGHAPVDDFSMGVAGLIRVGDDGKLTGHVITDRSGVAAHRRAALG
jgi:hypothetical protein